MAKKDEQCDHDWYKGEKVTIGGVKYVVMRCRKCPATYHAHA